LVTTIVVVTVSLLVWPFRAAWRRIRYGKRPRPHVERLIVVGLDGQDPKLTERSAAGKLPNFARLARRLHRTLARRSRRSRRSRGRRSAPERNPRSTTSSTSSIAICRAICRVCPRPRWASRNVSCAWGNGASPSAKAPFGCCGVRSRSGRCSGKTTCGAHFAGADHVPAGSFHGAH
jgi:hypothetical protein